MTYTIETYRRNIQAVYSLRDFMLFAAFFPQLLAGPINRAVNLLPQFERPICVTARDLEIGLVQFVVGAIKKLLISDRIAPHVDLIFESPGDYDGFTLFQGLLGYALQIYCDFSGYSDMAIGAARMLGFRFMENFQMPYSAVSITEFWKRWHISLSTWFRDYLYIPLGGNRKGVPQTYVNLVITMLLCGLWHGASWNFVLWGGIHGLSLALHRAWVRMAGRRSWLDVLMPSLPVRSMASRILTLGVVLISWLFFRAQTWQVAMDYFSRLISWSQDGTRFVSPYILPAVFLVFLIHVCVDKDRNWAHEIPDRGTVQRVVVYTALAVLLVCFGATDTAPFIYFRF